VGGPFDGVSGVENVGAKSTKKLLMEHGDLEGVLVAAADMKGVVGENLRKQADMARLSRRLTALRVVLSLRRDSRATGSEAPMLRSLLLLIRRSSHFKSAPPISFHWQEVTARSTERH
jgi:5'-3' exonuclease